MITALAYRAMDLFHRILRQTASSESGVGGPFGDSVGLPDVYYVDSGAGSDSNDGRDPAFPLATIDAAINKCTASQGDVILVQPGHSETLTTQISLDVIGVSIIGVGEGTLRPQITVNGNIDGIDIGAANCRVENLQFNEATAATADSAINVDAANAVIARCHFDLGANDDEGSITVTANGELLTVEDCTVVVTADGPDEWILFEGVVDRPVIRRCTVICSDGTDAFDDSAINFGDTDQAITNPVITECVFLGGGIAAVAIGGASALVGESFSRNTYAGGAAGGDNVDPTLGIKVVKSDGDPTAAVGAPDALFTVVGKVLVTLLHGEVTTIISGGTAPEIALQTTTDNLPIAASTVITDDAAGTLYMVSGDTGVILNGADAPSVVIAQVASAGHQPFILNGDGIEQLNGGGVVATGGVIEWTLHYIPLEAGASVVAAA